MCSIDGESDLLQISEGYKASSKREPASEFFAKLSSNTLPLLKAEELLQWLEEMPDEILEGYFPYMTAVAFLKEEPTSVRDVRPSYVAFETFFVPDPKYKPIITPAMTEEWMIEEGIDELVAFADYVVSVTVSPVNRAYGIEVQDAPKFSVLIENQTNATEEIRTIYCSTRHVRRVAPKEAYRLNLQIQAEFNEDGTRNVLYFDTPGSTTPRYVYLPYEYISPQTTLHVILMSKSFTFSRMESKE